MPRLTRQALALSAALLCLLPGAFLSACSDTTPKAETYLETGDLAALEERGRLRILAPFLEAPRLARRGPLPQDEVELAVRVAEELGLEAEVITVEDRSDMLERVARGEADVAVARLSVTPARGELVDFTVPLDRVREMLVLHRDAPPIEEWDDLAGLEIAVREGSSYAETLENVARDTPGVIVSLLPGTMSTDEILVGVADGLYDASVADEDIVARVSAYRPEIEAVFPVSRERPIAWALRKDSPALKAALDDAITRASLSAGLNSSAARTLDEIRESGVLRVLTRNSAATYFLYRGKRMGFEYELSKRFAERLGVRLQVIVPPDADQMIPWLLEGRGDLIASSWTVTDDRQALIAYSRPYMQISEMLVVRKEDAGRLVDIGSLAGRRVGVRPSSSYWETMEKLSYDHDFILVPTPEDLETEAMIDLVAQGEYDATVADSHILNVELTWRDDIDSAFPVSGPRDIAWAVRPDALGLLAEVDTFLDEEYRGTFFNILKRRYFENRRAVARRASQRFADIGIVSPYDDIFRKYGERFGFDWRLLAAQSFQESRFDPDQQSWAGALGLMQVLPRTARHMGETGDLHEPEVGVRAGARYMRWLYDLFEDSLPVGERIRFTLASYNVGHGHVMDARRVARELGLDPDVWFGNVEVAMTYLSKPEYARKARHGYCRCREPIAYVRQVNERYHAYASSTF